MEVNQAYQLTRSSCHPVSSITECRRSSLNKLCERLGDPFLSCVAHSTVKQPAFEQRQPQPQRNCTFLISAMLLALSGRKNTYPIVARKISCLELEVEKSMRSSAKRAVNAVISPSTKSLALILERAIMAMVGSRHATKVMVIDATRIM